MDALDVRPVIIDLWSFTQIVLVSELFQERPRHYRMHPYPRIHNALRWLNAHRLFSGSLRDFLGYSNPSFVSNSIQNNRDKNKPNIDDLADIGELPAVPCMSPNSSCSPSYQAWDINWHLMFYVTCLGARIIPREWAGTACFQSGVILNLSWYYVWLHSTRRGWEAFSRYWSRLVTSGYLKNEKLHLGRNRRILPEGLLLFRVSVRSWWTTVLTI